MCMSSGTRREDLPKSPWRRAVGRGSIPEAYSRDPLSIEDVLSARRYRIR